MYVNKIVSLYFRMKLIHIFLFLNFAATLAYGQYGDDCFLEESKIERLETTLIKITTKYKSAYELEFMNWEIQHWFF